MSHFSQQRYIGGCLSGILIALVLSGCGSVSELKEDTGILLELKRNEEAIQGALQAQEAIFQRALQAVRQNALIEGTSKDAVFKRVGEPTVRFESNSENEWIYRPGQDEWFGGRKIRLTFDGQNDLLKVECVRFSCGE